MGILEKKKKKKRLVNGGAEGKKHLDVNSCSRSADGGNLRTKKKKQNQSVKITVYKEERITRTLNPILVNFSESTKSRPSKTNAGLFMPAYTFSQSISLNSFHSVAMTTASASSHASMAELHIVTCFLTKRYRC